MDDSAGEGHIEVRAQIADMAHQQHENKGRGQLQQELCLRGEAGILMMADLLPVVQKSD